MNAIEGGRWDNLLRRFFSIKERGVAPSLAPEIVPVINVQDPNDPKNPFLLGERLMAATDEIAAVAAEFAIIELRNPVNSNAIVTMESAHAWTNAAAVGANLSVQLSSAEVNAVTKGLRDLRWDDGTGGLIQRSVADFLSYTDPALPGVLIATRRLRGAESPGADFNFPVVIPAGYSIFVTGDLVNTLYHLNIVWSERPVDRSEL